MSTTKKHYQLIGLNLLFWLILTVIAASLYYVNYAENYEGGWWTFFWRQFPIWMFWAVVSVFIFWLIRFLKKQRWPIWKHLLIHFASFGGLFFVYFLFFISYNLWLSEKGITLENIFNAQTLRFVLNYVLNLFIYLLVTASIYAWFWYEDLQKAELEKAAIQTQLQEAQLNMLTAQLHPHFLFNALNSISGLMRKGENTVAIQAIADLGQLLRGLLQFHPQQFISLKEEINFIAQYLKMEELRFKDKLLVKLHISPDVETILMPALLLQPLVENAIKHGIYKNNQKGALVITAKMEADFLLITVVNDCPANFKAFQLNTKKGMGIANVRQRLASIYPENNYDFRVTVLPQRKVQALLRLPILSDRKFKR